MPVPQLRLHPVQRGGSRPLLQPHVAPHLQVAPAGGRPAGREAQVLHAPREPGAHRLGDPHEDGAGRGRGRGRGRRERVGRRRAAPDERRRGGGGRVRALVEWRGRRRPAAQSGGDAPVARREVLPQVPRARRHAEDLPQGARQQCWFRTCECPKCVIINEWRRIQTDRKKVANQKRRELRLRSKQLLKAQAAGAAAAASGTASASSPTSPPHSRPRPRPILGDSRASGGDAASDASAANEELDNCSSADGSGDGSLHVADDEYDMPPLQLRARTSPAAEVGPGLPLPLPLPVLHSAALAPRNATQTELAAPLAPSAPSLAALDPAIALLCGPSYPMVLQLVSQLVAQAILQQVAAPIAGAGGNGGLVSLLQQLHAEQLVAILKLAGTASAASAAAPEAAALNLQLTQLQEQNQNLVSQQLLAQLQAAQPLGANALVGSPIAALQLQLPALAALSQLQAAGALPFAAAVLPPAAAATATTAPGPSPASQTEMANLLLALARGPQPPQQQSLPQSSSSPLPTPRAVGPGTTATASTTSASRNAGDRARSSYADRVEDVSQMAAAGALGARSPGLSVPTDRLVAVGEGTGVGRRARAPEASAAATSRARASNRKRAHAGAEPDVLLPQQPPSPPQLVHYARAAETRTREPRSFEIDGTETANM